jgi:predicted ATP-dependent protease
MDDVGASGPSRSAVEPEPAPLVDALSPLPAAALVTRCDPATLPFATTAEVADGRIMAGQERALEALAFGLAVHHKGFNIFAFGPVGTGRHTTVRRLVEREAEARPPGSDHCYVNNFDDPQRPRALTLPPGRANGLRQRMDRLVEELRRAIPAAFESETYRKRRQLIESGFKERGERSLREIHDDARKQGIALIKAPAGFVLAPVRDGEVLGKEDFDKLSDDERGALEKTMGELHERLHATLRQVQELEKEERLEVKELDREVTQIAVEHLIDAVRTEYADLPKVLEHLSAVEHDVIDNAGDLLRPEAGGGDDGMAALMRVLRDNPPFRRYQVNVLVDRDGAKGAPVVFEDHPTVPNLVGRIDHMSQFGSLVTDFNLVRPGALQRANGGYLVLDALELLSQPFAWETLKRALRSGEIRIESTNQLLGIGGAPSLEPDPIPLDVKVVLVGEPRIYYLLGRLDPEFGDLFKVAADFDDEMLRTAESALSYAALIADLSRTDGLRAFDRTAVARLVDWGARLAGDATRLSTSLRSLTDLATEADHLAGREDHIVVTAGDVDHAIEARIRRESRIRERVHEEIHRGTLLIDTRGRRVGQVNGLSVVEWGELRFGFPSRITARVRIGRGEVLDIEREVALSGPIHSKGVLILAGFLGGRFGKTRPLSLSASLVFEQSYGGVEGDSASLAELCALLSELTEAPVRQSFAVTGSVNQHGDVQAVGGVNEKIEGFFDVCAREGLTGEQGVLLPAANAPHLMLRDDVVAAATEGLFRVHVISTVDQALELLMGVPAGARDGDGRYPDGSLNQRAEARLERLAEAARAGLPDKGRP